MKREDNSRLGQLKAVDSLAAHLNTATKVRGILVLLLFTFAIGAYVSGLLHYISNIGA